MPIYEYRCKKCGKTLEIIHSFGENQKLCNSDCQADDKPGDGEIEPLISTPAKLTKGLSMVSGKTDYDKAAKKGFTTYKRQGKGNYERVAGSSGPSHFVAKNK